ANTLRFVGRSFVGQNLDVVSKGSLADLPDLVAGIREQGATKRMLTVDLTKRVEFMALREYIFELSRVAPLRYVVLLKGADDYLGFVSVAEFKERFPRHSLELLLNESTENSPLGQEYQQLLNGDHRSLREQVHDRVLALYWRADDPFVRSDDLTRLGAS